MTGRYLTFEATIDAYNAVERLAYERGATDDEIEAAVFEAVDDYPDELHDRWRRAWTKPSDSYGQRGGDEPLLCDWCGENEADIRWRVHINRPFYKSSHRFFCGETCRAKWLRDRG